MLSLIIAGRIKGIPYNFTGQEYLEACAWISAPAFPTGDFNLHPFTVISGIFYCNSFFEF
jgi:hypothetical protein